MLVPLHMAKQKLSMAEKRKRRQAKSRSTENLSENLPKCKLDFKSKPSSVDEDKPQRFQNPTEAAEKAKELLMKQRESVDMLTMVRQRVEALPKEEIMKALDNEGYYILDSFLNDKSAADRLSQEAKEMFDGEEMEIDTANLGMGEYTVPIKGGTEQYAKCPRSVELVVSTTKHIPEVFEDLVLDASACMANLRVFSASALKASMSLLLGDDAEDIGQSTRPFETVINGDENDKRRLSMQYYLVPEAWNDNCGGGLTFHSSDDGEASFVSAKNDRLILWKSDTTMLRKEIWKGDADSNEFGGCIELHLVCKMDDPD